MSKASGHSNDDGTSVRFILERTSVGGLVKINARSLYTVSQVLTHSFPTLTL